MMSSFEQQSFINMVYFYNKELRNINNIKHYLTAKDRLRLTKRNIISYSHKEKSYKLTSKTKEILKKV